MCEIPETKGGKCNISPFFWFVLISFIYFGGFPQTSGGHILSFHIEESGFKRLI